MLGPVELVPFAVFVLSGLVQGTAGFGGSLVAMAFLPLVWELQTAVGVSAVFGIVVPVALAIRLWRHVQWREVAGVLLAAVVGVPMGVYLLHNVPARWVKLALGIILVSHGTWSLLGGRGSTGMSSRWGPVAGLTGGMLSGAFSTAGPPILVYATGRAWPKDTFRGNLQAIFLTTGVLSLIGFAATGVVTAATFQTNLTLLPALLAGGFFGHLLSGRIDQDRFRRIVLIGLLVMGGNYIVRALT